LVNLNRFDLVQIWSKNEGFRQKTLPIILNNRIYGKYIHTSQFQNDLAFFSFDNFKASNVL